MNTMRQSSTPSAEQQLLLATFAESTKPGDRLVLSDEILHAALERSRRLRKSELQALLDSPLTLRRLVALAARFDALSQESSPAAREAAAKVIAIAMGRAANDSQPTWHRSPMELMAAAGHDDGNFSQTSPDQLWVLHAIVTGTSTRLVLVLQKDHERAAAVMEARQQLELAVLDGQGATLLMGHLDEDGELAGPWQLPDTLRSHLLAQGGQFSIERV